MRSLFLILLSMMATNSAFAVTDKEISDIIRSTHISGEGVPGGYDDDIVVQPINFSRHSTRYDATVEEVQSEYSNILFYNTGNIWAYKVGIRRDEDADEVTVYLAYHNSRTRNLEFKYYTIHVNTFRDFAKNHQKVRLTKSQKEQGDARLKQAQGVNPLWK